jgi:hypothetical protein
MSNGWIGVDLDGTLAKYHGWVACTHIGEPIPAMVDRVKSWLSEGREVRIFTARVAPLLNAMSPRYQEAWAAQVAIKQWCKIHIGDYLPVTCVKDLDCIEFWDDRAVTVEMNTGLKLSVTTRGTNDEITDSERLDALESLATKGQGWILRRSTMDRGMRLHEADYPVHGASRTAREAIDKFLSDNPPAGAVKKEAA